MLAVNGGVRLWHMTGVTDMRYGKFRLLRHVEEKHRNPYNGDAYLFLSKDRKTLKILRHDGCKVVLYDVSYEKGYKFLRPVYKAGDVRPLHACIGD